MEENLKTKENCTSAAIIANGDEPHDVDDKDSSKSGVMKLAIRNTLKRENKILEYSSDEILEHNDSSIDGDHFEVVRKAEINGVDENNKSDDGVQKNRILNELDKNFTVHLFNSKGKHSYARKRKLSDDSTTESRQPTTSLKDNHISQRSKERLDISISKSKESKISKDQSRKWNYDRERHKREPRTTGRHRSRSKDGNSSRLEESKSSEDRSKKRRYDRRNHKKEFRTTERIRSRSKDGDSSRSVDGDRSRSKEIKRSNDRSRERDYDREKHKKESRSMERNRSRLKDADRSRSKESKSSEDERNYDREKHKNDIRTTGRNRSRSKDGDRSISKESKISNDRSRERDYDRDKRKPESSKSNEEMIKQVDKRIKQEKHRLMLEKLWNAVKKNSSDFTRWTYLLQYVDQENDVESAREAFDKFLSLYPYCYGYWRKYCDLLKKNDLQDECNQVFEKGVNAIPLSVDLWIHYINIVKNNLNKEELRDLYNRAVEKCGMEFKSDRLWESVIKWETDMNNLKRVRELYDRWLATPTALSVAGEVEHVSVMRRFTEFVRKHPPRSILSSQEYLNLCSGVTENQKLIKDSNELDDASPAEELSTVVDEDDEVKIVKEKIISIREEINEKTMAYFRSRAVFENAISRSYFHVKPMEAFQLDNWNNYLDHEIAEGNQERIIFLFERCLIASAMYGRFWLKYVEYLNSQNIDPEKIREVFNRACTIHLKDKIKMHMEWSLFEEKLANYDSAAEILDKFLKKIPTSLLAMCERINIERRRGDLTRAEQLFESYCNNEPSLGSNLFSAVCVKYAEFSAKILHDLPKSQRILQNAIKKYKTDMRLILKLFELCQRYSQINGNEILKFLDEIVPIEDISDKSKKTLYSQRKLELLFNCSDNCVEIHDAYKKYNELASCSITKKSVTSDVPDVQNYSFALTENPVPPSAYYYVPVAGVASSSSQMPYYQQGYTNYDSSNVQVYATAPWYGQQQMTNVGTSCIAAAVAPYGNNIVYNTPPPSYHGAYSTAMYNNDPNYNHAAYYNTYSGQYNSSWTMQNPDMFGYQQQPPYHY